MSIKKSYEIIQQNTGVSEPYKFLVIEKAVEKNQGQMMKDYIKKHLIVKKTKDE